MVAKKAAISGWSPPLALDSSQAVPPVDSTWSSQVSSATRISLAAMKPRRSRPNASTMPGRAANIAAVASGLTVKGSVRRPTSVPPRFM
jgi:hypothetical protein